MMVPVWRRRWWAITVLGITVLESWEGRFVSTAIAAASNVEWNEEMQQDPSSEDNEYFHEYAERTSNKGPTYQDFPVNDDLDNERRMRNIEQANRIAMERDKAFQAELNRMNKEQQKAALRQKRRDARMVRSVLRAFQQEDLYGVLGIRNWNWHIPERTINFFGRFKWHFPGVTLKRTSGRDIRKAYRNRAVAVHPDKNRDGRAQEAFIAVENSAAILSNDMLREAYDEEIRLSKLERRERQIELLVNIISYTYRMGVKGLKAIHSKLGPFSVPVLILVALLI